MVAAGVIAAVLIAGDSKPSHPAEDEAATSATSLAATQSARAAKAPAPERAEPRTAWREDHGTSQGQQDRSGHDHGNGPAASGQAGSSPRHSADKAHKGSTDSHQDPSDAGCPPAFSHAECVALGRAYQSAGSHPVEKGECPPPFSHAECVELGRAYRQAKNTTRPVNASECPPGFSQSECVAMGEAYRASK
jgi:hypothetical protein